MGTTKDINGRALVDAEEMKKKWKEYTEELYKKDPNELDDYNGVVSHPESDILKSKVKWVLGSTAINKASGCNRIPVELFKILKDDAIKVLPSIKWPQDWKRSILLPISKKGNTKECANHQTIALISHASKVMLKILHARFMLDCILGFSIMWTKNFQITKRDLEKEEKPEIKLPTFSGS